MFVFGVLVNVFIFIQLVFGGPVESDKEVHGFHEYDTLKTLELLGDKIYGQPKASSGVAVSKWTPSSGSFPEELGGYFEGDILHTEPFNRNFVKRKSLYWPNKVVPYEISPNIRGSAREMILSAINQYHKQTCLKFRQRTQSDVAHIYFDNQRAGCFSAIGRTGRRQLINLQTPSCTSAIGTVIHEILHAVGFLHEQSRPDRDQFVTIHFENVQRGMEHNFNKASRETVSDAGIGYDYGSVMHYGGNFFSKNGRPTIVPKVSGKPDTDDGSLPFKLVVKNQAALSIYGVVLWKTGVATVAIILTIPQEQKGVRLGQHRGFSQKDLQKVRAMYSC